ARLLLDEHEARRDQHAGVGGEHRAREARAERVFPLEQPEEALQVGFLDRTTVGLLEEISQQPLCVLLWRLGNHLDRHVDDGAALEDTRPANARWKTTGETADRWTRSRGHGLERHAALLVGAELSHRQVTEQQPVTTGGA